MTKKRILCRICGKTSARSSGVAQFIWLILLVHVKVLYTIYSQYLRTRRNMVTKGTARITAICADIIKSPTLQRSSNIQDEIHPPSI